MTDPAITVIVPGLDVAPYVPAALDSLRNQTRGDWRAILIDDGSTDQTGHLFERAAARDERFRALLLPRTRGLGAARNAGLELVTTPFVGFLDADDEFTPSALERMIGTLEHTGSDFVIGAYTRLRPQPDGTYLDGPVQPWVAAATSPERHRVTLDEHPAATGSIVAWAKVSRARVWDELRFPEGRLYEDQVVAQRMLVSASVFDTIPDVVVRWRMRPDGSSITQRESELGVLRDCLEAMSEGLNVLRGHSEARQARVDLIKEMDVPRLRTIADSHPDLRYREALDAFEGRLDGGRDS